MEKNNIKNLVNKILFEDYNSANEILKNILIEKQKARENIAYKLAVEAVSDGQDIPDSEPIEAPTTEDSLGFTNDDEDQELEQKAVCFTTNNKDIIDLFNNGFVKLSITKIGLNNEEEVVDFDINEIDNISVLDIDDDSENDDSENDEDEMISEADENNEDDEDDEDVEDNNKNTENNDSKDDSNDSETPTEGEGLDKNIDDNTESDDNQEDSQKINDDTIVSDDSEITNDGNGPSTQDELDDLANQINQTKTKETIGLLEIQKENLSKLNTEISNIRPEVNNLKPEGIATTEVSRPYVAAMAMIDAIDQAKNELTVYIQNKIDYLTANADTTETVVSDDEFATIDKKVAYLSSQLDVVKSNYLGGDKDELDDIATDIEDKAGTNDSVDNSEASSKKEGESDNEENSEKSEEQEKETSSDDSSEKPAEPAEPAKSNEPAEPTESDKEEE